MSSFSCFVVGDGVLPLSCLEILLQKNCQVLGVYSTDHSLQKWSQEHGITHAPSRHVFHKTLLEAEYDYLFSINNIKWIIPADAIARAKKATINYHDSPLPKYAGLYATSWALLNGETEYAITWHEVACEIDAGRIFKQKAVPILPDDTVFNLNVSCFDAAVNSFTELVQELAMDLIEPWHQDLSQRSYFSSSDRPDAAALISFDVSSKDICNLVKALDFGPIRNELGLPKVWLPGGVVAVGSAHVIKTASGTPGQVLKLGEEGMCVATIDGAVQLSGLTTLRGKNISPAQLRKDYSVCVGDVLPVIDGEVREAINQRNAAICRYEQIWSQRLMQLAPFRHPYLPREMPNQSLDISMDCYGILLSTEQVEAKSLLAMFAAYCGRLATEMEFDLGLQTDSQRSIAPEIFAQRVPIRVQTQIGESFSQFQKRFAIALDDTSRLGSFRHSLLRRYPELQDSLQSNFLPVAIALASSPDCLDWHYLEASMVFVAYEDGSLPELIHTSSLNEADSQAIVQQLQSFITACIEHPQQPLHQLPLLSVSEQQQILGDWNDTAQPLPTNRCIHELFEIQAESTPDGVAVAFQERQLTYRELNEQANQLAHYLQLQGVGPDVLVGIHLERSLEMMIGLLAIHKAGGAYLPLDPDFPPERLALMLADSQAPVILTEEKLIPKLVVNDDVCIIPIDMIWGEITQQPIINPHSGVKPENLSYIIYTSGSTGKPKGVMVEHRNVVNFFTGMDAVIDHDPPGVWLAVTSLSFDISVLELFWTLARGFKVVIYNPKQERQQSTLPPSNQLKHTDFSLFYFSSHEQGEDAATKYRLLLEGAKFADANGFKAIWTPERHFHAFGGLFPNPVISSAAIATITKHIQIRAGSCVSPLHHSVRLAEDWALVDNLSGGRVGISFAAGWQPNDFVLCPQAFENRKEIMFEQVEEVRKLWQGGTLAYPNGKGEIVEVQTLPRPIQPTLPVWITAAGNPETFHQAGASGANILTHLLGQGLDELAAKIAIYRQAWQENGHSGQGIVTVMMHTFVGESDDIVKEIVRQPMRQYLASSLDLIKLAAWSFPTFKQKTTDEKGRFAISHLSDPDMVEVLDFSFERYFETSGLFGTVDTCLQMVNRVRDIGVDEIACLIDYGVDTDRVLSQLPLLNELKTLANDPTPTESIADLIQGHGVTHLQCTPSMANLLIAETATRKAMGQLREMMVGGEALTEALAIQLQEIVPGRVHNMYGPTETTIWSATHTLGKVDGVVPIGRPIANTELYILDKHQQPVPVGVAGELYIGGKGVTRGYLHRPELTQERFVPNPFSTDATARLYRTGDEVRYGRDGNVEFLGRMDFQVKVRGYRIELGEIETILNRHEAIREGVVVVREDVPGDKRLVAYLIPQPGHEPTNATMREYLLSLLPEYMIPSNFVLLAAFPLTPNQKVDRQALPAPMLVAAAGDTCNSRISQNQIEQTLIELWQQVLQISPVGIKDNFFHLGGNSLVAVRLIGEIRSVFNVDLPLICLFRSPTISDIAKLISNSYSL
ncbi:MupA/Atu3671 family FMN-dependent luciferase-like monooxygenase [Anabaena sp. UHCC 0204]|uniref:MupA/Atu3671 family FMN-dependent luciferase-like monooxygenase n=1 Tax=Anabaena sp. UHCC 0204 TaxID=2590009 RepID=UPI001447AC09|nr:MupA/Atu3671 family FMN-dependent luciferase-like monooxygenase [Anabaena sp. UHCC 0204]MTJ07339.1 LLM class flavin-dependent oxidoreductase [Anabaena sp. UHCC 0204]